MPASNSGYDVGEFDRECRAAKNRLAELRVKNIATREATRNEKRLMQDDLRTLAIIVEEEKSLDPILGLYTDGVSRSAVGDLMGYKNTGSTKNRFDKLKDANLIREHEASDLPKMRHGANPKYAVATDVGRQMVENLGLVPIVTRDRDLEEQFDMLVADYRELRKSYIKMFGRQMFLIEKLNRASYLNNFHFNDDYEDLPKYGEHMLDVDLTAGLSLADDEYSFGKLIGEMDEAERELAMRELLNEDRNEDADETTD